MNSDFKDLLKNFIEFEVRFLIVGGVAVIRYTEPRYTKDLDVLIDNSLENAKKVYESLKQFGAPLVDVTIEDFTVAGNFYQIGIAPNRVDIINEISGVDFNQAYNRKELVKIDGLEMPFIGLEDLINAKLAAGRPQDLVDAGALAKKKNEKK